MIGATHPVGVIGIGPVGLALVERLRAARIKVVGYDIDPMRCEALRATSSVVAGDANEVFGACDNVVLALPDGGRTAALVREALPVIRAGLLVVDCGTSDPDQTVALAVRLAAPGVRLVDTKGTQMIDGEIRLGVMSVFFLTLVDAIGEAWTFWLFAVFCTVGGIWIYRFPFVRSWPCSTLPSDPVSRRRPCASLTLHHHQAG